MFTREELQDIRDRANDSLCDNLNSTWARAYIALAEAADHLDAIKARSTIYPLSSIESWTFVSDESFAAAPDES